MARSAPGCLRTRVKPDGPGFGSQVSPVHRRTVKLAAKPAQSARRILSVERALGSVARVREAVLIMVRRANASGFASVVLWGKHLTQYIQDHGGALVVKAAQFLEQPAPIDGTNL